MQMIYSVREGKISVSYTLSKTIQTQTRNEAGGEGGGGGGVGDTEELFDFLLCRGWIETLELVQ